MTIYIHGALVSRCRAENRAGSLVVMAVQQSDGLVIEAVFSLLFSPTHPLESVVPSSGTFHVKLPKRRGVELGITISGELPDANGRGRANITSLGLHISLFMDQCSVIHNCGLDCHESYCLIKSDE